MMNIKQMPIVKDDKGFRNDSEAVAHSKMMVCSVGLCLNDMQKTIERHIADAYLQGAQAAISIGYRLAEKEYDGVLNDKNRQSVNWRKGWRA